jgi:hypothetical protein
MMQWHGLCRPATHAKIVTAGTPEKCISEAEKLGGAAAEPFSPLLGDVSDHLVNS